MLTSRPDCKKVGAVKSRIHGTHPLAEANIVPDADELRRLKEDLALAIKRADERQRDAHDERTTKMAAEAVQKVEMIKQRIDEIVHLGLTPAPK
jgi:hypothetical protein